MNMTRMAQNLALASLALWACACKPQNSSRRGMAPQGANNRTLYNQGANDARKVQATPSPSPSDDPGNWMRRGDGTTVNITINSTGATAGPGSGAPGLPGASAPGSPATPGLPGPGQVPGQNPNQNPGQNGGVPVPRGTPSTPLVFCAGGSYGKSSQGARATNILSSLEEARACAQKIARVGKWGTKFQCSRYASFGWCEANGLPTPWGVSPDEPGGKAGPAPCECLYGETSIKPERYPLWMVSLKWDEGPAVHEMP